MASSSAPAKPRFRITAKPYSAAIDRIRALDLILFSDVDLISGAIRKLEKFQSGNGQFSHVGIVVNKALMPYIPQLQEGELYVMESTFSHGIEILGKKIVQGPPDVISGSGHFGVQIRSLREVVKSYKGKVFRGRILKNPWVFYKDEKYEDVKMRRGKVISQVGGVFKEYYGNGYNRNPFHLLGIISPKARRVRNITQAKDGKTKSVVCSQLVAITYIAVEVLPDTVDPRDAQPTDFDGSDADKQIDNILCDHLIELTPD